MSVSLLADKINGLLIPGEACIGIGGAGLIGANGVGNGAAGNGAAGNGVVEVMAADDSADAMRAGKGSSLTSSLTSNTDGIVGEKGGHTQDSFAVASQEVPVCDTLLDRPGMPADPDMAASEGPSIDFAASRLRFSGILSESPAMTSAPSGSPEGLFSAIFFYKYL